MKRLRDDASEEEKIKFLQEAVILSQFSHMNVLKLHGVVVEGEVRKLHAVLHLDV